MPFPTGYDGAATTLFGPTAVTTGFVSGGIFHNCLGYEKLGVSVLVSANGAPALASLRVRVRFDTVNGPAVVDDVPVVTVAAGVVVYTMTPREFALTPGGNIADGSTFRFEVDTQGASLCSIEVMGDQNSVGSSVTVSVVRFSTGRQAQ